ncbi:MAG: HEPN domain-containing protein [Elusimicrobia bacterium]|nr:HEPN domain-containing protein [Candidatus Obscuribacterium magneticum]
MTHFDPQFFKTVKFASDQIESYLSGAIRNLEIARKSDHPEVQFTFAYQALLKAGIALIAKIGSVKVRSVPGHHVRILEKMSETLSKPDIFLIGNQMRLKRNLDLYEGRVGINPSEAQDFLEFVEETLEEIKKVVRPRKK